MKKTKTARLAACGEALTYLGHKLIELTQQAWHYYNETLPALQHAEAQRTQDMHSIEAALRSGDFDEIARLADSFKRSEPHPEAFTDWMKDCEVTPVGDADIPF
jgi:hypothetical protein